MVLGRRNGKGQCLRRGGALICACNTNTWTNFLAGLVYRLGTAWDHWTTWAALWRRSLDVIGLVSTFPHHLQTGRVRTARTAELGIPGTAGSEGRAASPLVRCGRNDARAHLYLPRAARLPDIGASSDRQSIGRTWIFILLTSSHVTSLASLKL